MIFYETKVERNARLTCRHFFIPLKTFYKWQKRFDKKNLRTLEDGHPHPKTFESLDGVKVLRTDLDGDIKVVTDGKEYQIKKKDF